LPANHLDKTIGAYKQRGLRVIGSLSPCLQVQVWQQHPDLRVISQFNGPVPELEHVKT
jgi:hypothetical protein